LVALVARYLPEGKRGRPQFSPETMLRIQFMQQWFALSEPAMEEALHDSPRLGTRQYARILGHWVDELGLDRAEYGTHSIRRTRATLIYRRTKNLRAVQLLLGHSKLESTVRYLGIEVDDALEISEQTEI
jgi:integrase